jgi:MFS family permease
MGETGVEATAATTTEPGDLDLDEERGLRPTELLPMSQLARISAYWLGLTAIDAAVGLFITNRLEFGKLVPKTDVGTTFFLITVVGITIGIILQPTVGYLSDFTVSRWGRRKPYIVFGSLLDLVFLAGIASGNSVVVLAGFFALLQFSTNIARGPFQGYVPDLVAAPQVGLASAMVGLMQVAGNVTGFLIVAISVTLDVLPLSLIAVAVVELVTMASVVLKVGKGMPPRPRQGRSWLQIARGAWSTDILQERSYVWLLVSRLLFMTSGALLVNWVVVYLSRAFSMDANEANGTYIVVLAVVLVANGIAIIPASRLSDRIGRKPLIWGACAAGLVGAAIVAVAPVVPVALVGAFLFGASQGSFLAVDWALMTDIIPRVSAGRYMGLSNVATGASGPISIAIGGQVLDFVSRAGYLEMSPRAVFILSVVGFVLAALTLRPVVEPRRDPKTGGVAEVPNPLEAPA